MVINCGLLSSLQLKTIPSDVKHSQRFRILALYKNGINKNIISEFIGCSMDVVSRWSERSDINDNPRSGRPLVYNEEILLKLIAFYCQTTPIADCGRWTLRWAERHLEKDPHPVGAPLSHSTIGRILNKHNLKPHLSKYFLHITDSNFFPKMENLLPLYMNRPKHLYCFDECPGIQILQRLAPDLRTERMKARLEEFEYIRNGTMDVFAFLQVETGQVFAECHADHKIKTLLEVFERHLKSLPENETIHYIMDNLASHSSYEICKLVAKYCQIECPSKKELKTAGKRREWLQSANKQIVFHYTPFHGSWLNMVEIWFGILKKKCLQESFKSPEALFQAIYDFCHEWDTLLAHPFKWNYDGKGLHQKAVDRFIKILEYSLEEIPMTFMTKQFLLMTNLIEGYWEEVSVTSWLKLNKIINSEVERFNDIIADDDGPKRKEKAKAALLDLIYVLSTRIDRERKQVA